MIFLGLCDICGYYSQLERGLIEIGEEVTLVNAFPSGVYPRTTRPPWVGRIVEAIAERRVASGRGTLPRFAWTLLQGLAMVPLFCWAAATCRVLVFAGGTSFFPPFDLAILRLLRKRVILVFHGTDARPPYINGAVACESPHELRDCIADTRRKARRLRTLERYADVIVNHVLTSHLHQRPIVAWLNVGIPYPVQPLVPPPSRADRACVIVHAPTRPGPKGSHAIEAAIERLRARGHDIRFVKLVGRTNAEVLDAIRSCDFVVDELFSDTTMASFATEAASFGKPAIVGVYGFELLRRWTASELLPPAVVCEADSVEPAIERLIVDEHYRLSAGAAAREFVATRWSPAQVAGRFARLCHDDIPPEWRFNPADAAYVFGWGLTKDAVKRRLNAVLAAGGIEALQLDDKPAVRDAMTAFAHSNGRPC